MLQNDVADPSDNIVTNLKALDMITVCFALNNVMISYYNTDINMNVFYGSIKL